MRNKPGGKVFFEFVVFLGFAALMEKGRVEI